MGCVFVQIAHDVAEGLAYMHPSVIHRDLKPQNILIDGLGRVKIADFGISRVKVSPMEFLQRSCHAFYPCTLSRMLA